MLLDVLLKRVVGDHLLDTQQGCQLLIRSKLATIGRVLKVLLLHIVANGLGDIDARHQLVGLEIAKLGHVGGDLDRLHEARVAVASRGLANLAREEAEAIGLQAFDLARKRAKVTNANRVGLVLAKGL